MGALYQYAYEKAALVTVVDPLGERCSYGYDALNNRVQETFPDGTVQTTTYGMTNQPATVMRPSGTTLTHTYDPAGRLVRRQSSLGDIVQFTWDAGGALSRLQDATGTTQYHYDRRGGLRGLETPQGARLHYERDAVGRVIAVTAQATPSAPEYVTQYTYDAVGNLITVRDPLGGVTTLVYDAANRLIRRTLPNGVVSTYTYDLRDRLTALAHQRPDGTVLAAATYTRGTDGAPTQILWEDGSAVQLTYDPAWRLTTETFVDATGRVTEEVAYTYDAAGNRRTRAGAGGAARYHRPARRDGGPDPL